MAAAHRAVAAGTQDDLAHGSRRIAERAGRLAAARYPLPPCPTPPRAPPNRLAAETSAYLRQHMHNPVDWHPWGEEALARARRRGQAAARLDRLQRLPLVPRDGARVLRGRGRRPR